jgi:hypothetical protein
MLTRIRKWFTARRLRRENAVAYAAVEIRSYETPHKVVEHIMIHAANAEQRFLSLYVYGVTSLATINFVRFRSDVSLDVLETMLHQEGRAIIVWKDDHYEVKYRDGIKPKQVPTYVMLASETPITHRRYKGPKIKTWEQQFL